MLKLFQRDDSHQFKPLLAEIEDDPGSPLGPLTFWLVIGVFAFFLVWAIFGQVDVVVTARGKVIPVGQVKVLQPLNGGVISAILVKEGDFVKKGQPLVHIDPSATEPQLQSSQETLAHVQLEQARLTAAANRRGFSGGDDADAQTQVQLHAAALASLQKQLSAKQQLLAGLDQQLQGKQVEIRHTQETLRVAEEKESRLSKVQDIVSRDEYERATTELLTQQNRVKELAHELEHLRFQQAQTREEMGYLQQNFKSTTLSELSEKEKQITQLKANIQESSFRNSRQTLTAPVDGYVHELFIHTVGGVVTPAQKVLSVVPVNTPLLVQATVLNKDVGFIKKDMQVALKVDTFDFQKYGILKAQVLQVDKDSRDDEKLGPVYNLYITPLEQKLKVNGHWQALSTGLSVTAEIKTGKRRIIEFFIYPLIKHLDEGMSVR